MWASAPTKAPLGHKGSWPEGPEGIRTPQIPECPEIYTKSPPSFSSKMPPPLTARGAARGGFRISESLSANPQALPYFHVGANAHIGPPGSYEFAVDFRKNGVFCVGRCGHRPLQRLPLGTRGVGPKGLRGFERRKFRNTLNLAADPLRHFLRKCHLPFPRGARQEEAWIGLRRIFHTGNPAGNMLCWTCKNRQKGM